MRNFTFIIPIALLFLLGLPSFLSASSSQREIRLPEGFKIETFAENLGSPRFMALSPEGVLFATLMDSGKVVALPDADNDGKADKAITFLEKLNRPHGIAFHKGYIYIGETDQISRFKFSGLKSKTGKKEVVIANLPTGGHFTRTVGFGPDGKMYVSVGSSCNVCEEGDERRAAILKANPDGSDIEVFAKGLRNSVGIAWHPETGEMWATDNGRDWLGDDLPPEEINIVASGNHYGWPYCYGDRVPDSKYDKYEFCKNTTPPAFKMQAHSAPLGLAFYTGKSFPEQYRGDIFVAFHGSWNRSKPTGYKVVRIKVRDGKPVDIEDFASGWLKDGDVSGRPVDVLAGADGGLFISDDGEGIIYKITYNKQLTN